MADPAATPNIFDTISHGWYVLVGAISGLFGGAAWVSGTQHRVAQLERDHGGLREDIRDLRLELRANHKDVTERIDRILIAKDDQ